MKILVMGGSRFIGRHVLRKLKGHQVTVVNRGSVDPSKYLPEGATAYKVDRNNLEEMKAALGDKEFDIVLDISCITENHAQIFLETLEGRVKRHVHVSTGSVYDESKIPEYVPVDEDYDIGPINEQQHPYMNSKRGAEKVLLEAEKRGYNLAIVRPTFVYGSFNYVYREAYFFDRISRDRPILIPEEGAQDLVHAEDLAEIIVKLGFSDHKGAFNGSTGRIVTGEMLAYNVAKVLGKEPKIQFFRIEDFKGIEWPENFALYPYMPKGIMAFSAEKLQRELGFNHKYSYVEGLKEAYKWWSKQENPEPNWKVEDLLMEYLNADEKRREEIRKNELPEAFERAQETLK